MPKVTKEQARKLFGKSLVEKKPRGCSKKVYKTKAEARRNVWLNTLNEYKCGHCGMWHIGHNKKVSGKPLKSNVINKLRRKQR